MKSSVSPIAFCVLVAVCGSLPAAEPNPSGHRVAWLIANTKFDNTTLLGGRESLDLLEKTLTENGFRTIRRENLDEDGLDSLPNEIAQSLPTNGVGLVYLYGFAVAIERGDVDNYLRPANTEIRNSGDYRSRGMGLDNLLEQLAKSSGARTHLIFVDAGWDSPIRPEGKEVKPGLQPQTVPADVFLMFGTPTGTVVSLPERKGPSPFAKAIAGNLSRFPESIKTARDKISEDLGGVWSTTPSQVGIGVRDPRPIVEDLREGKVAGESFVNSLGMSFRWCPPGTFTMGSDEVDSPQTSDRSPVEVTLSRGFWMAEHELTQREYYVVARRNVRANFTLGLNIPYWGINEVKGITQFCEKLSDIERKAGRLPDGWEYAAPTEAQWEYACRAGSDSRYSFGDEVSRLGEYGNFADRTLREENPNYFHAETRSADGVGENLAAVGSYRPNAWGIRDMHGNVAELVADHHVPELPGGTDPLARVEKDGLHVLRGGAWCSTPDYCESSFRNIYPGKNRSNFVGFRIVLQKKR